MIMRTLIFTNNTPPSRISHRRVAPYGRETLVAAAIVVGITRLGDSIESALHRPPIDSTAEGHGWLVYT
jgi:hypothetical protein